MSNICKHAYYITAASLFRPVCMDGMQAGCTRKACRSGGSNSNNRNDGREPTMHSIVQYLGRIINQTLTQHADMNEILEPGDASHTTPPFSLHIQCHHLHQPAPFF